MDDDRHCTARSKRSGVRCRRFPVPGASVCVIHGGKAPQVQAAAKERIQEAAAADVVAKLVWKSDAVPVTNAVAALQLLAGQLQHAADVLGSELDAGDLEPVRAAAWLRVLRELRTALSEMERLGIAGKSLEIEAGRVRLMAAAISAMFAVLDIPEPDQEMARSAFFSALRVEAEKELAGGPVPT